jgi:hypothetical protein
MKVRQIKKKTVSVNEGETHKQNKAKKRAKRKKKKKKKRRNGERVKSELDTRMKAYIIGIVTHNICKNKRIYSCMNRRPCGMLCARDYVIDADVNVASNVDVGATCWWSKRIVALLLWQKQRKQ